MYKPLIRTVSLEVRRLLQSWQSLPEDNPILVYSMRKVGSTTLTNTLRSAGHRTYKHHCIEPVFNGELQDLLSRTGFPRQHWLTDGAHFYNRLARWRARRERISRENRLKIFSFIKDPLAIALSDYFMQLFEFMPEFVVRRELADLGNLRRYFEEVICVAMSGTSADPVTDYLAKLISIPSLWFDREMKATMRIDVFDTPFPKEKGYVTCHGNDCDIALIRTDRLSEVAHDAICDLLDKGPETIISQNVRSGLTHGELYRSLVDAMSLPESMVRNYYSRHTWLNHVYDNHEVENMIRRWTRNPTHRLD